MRGTVLMVPHKPVLWAKAPLLMVYTPSPAEAEFDGLTAGFETIQLCP